MGEYNLSGVGGAIEGIGKGIEHAEDGTGRFIEKIHSLTSNCWLPHKSRKCVDAADIKAKGALKILEEVGATPSEQDRRALAFAALREIRGFENLEATISYIDIPSNAKVDDIEDEWLAAFLDAAENAYSEWKRELLGHAATNKAVDPSDISLSLLTTIPKLDVKLMKAFRIVCGLFATVGGKLHDPVLFDCEEALQLIGLSTDNLNKLSEIGLIRETAHERRLKCTWSRTFEMMAEDKRGLPYEIADEYKFGYVQIEFGGKPFKMPVIKTVPGSLESTVFDLKGEMCIDFGFYKLTSIGHELSHLVEKNVPDGLQEYLNAGALHIQSLEYEAHPSIPFADRKLAQKVDILLGQEIARQRRRRGR